MATYTITRALSRINALQDKIQKAADLTYVTTVNTIKLNSEDTLKTLTDLKANIQSAEAIKLEILKLKLKIQESNLSTIVTINNKEMTVREAIELKYLYENYFSRIANVMTDQLRRSKLKQSAAQTEIENSQQEAIKQLTAMDSSISAEEVESRSKVSIELVRQTKELSVISFNGTEDAENSVKNYIEEISTYLEEVDYVLSESNATTTIEV